LSGKDFALLISTKLKAFKLFPSIEIMSGIERVIENTNLKPYATLKDIIDLIKTSNEYKMYGVVVNPMNAQLAHGYIKGNRYNLKVITVVDFPLGASPSKLRKDSIKYLARYVDEVDVVAPISYVKSGLWESVERDINDIVKTAHSLGLVVKIIAEDAYTTPDEKEKLYKIIMQSGADFIKTSTGFEDSVYAQSIGNKTGAQFNNVKLMAQMSKYYNPSIGIKVSGGIRTYQQAIDLSKAAGRPFDPKGFRIGTSHALEIINDEQK
jgi:deoxyribose-phosphate aldolase